MNTLLEKLKTTENLHCVLTEEITYELYYDPKESKFCMSYFMPPKDNSKFFDYVMNQDEELGHKIARIRLGTDGCKLDDKQADIVATGMLLKKDELKFEVHKE